MDCPICEGTTQVADTISYAGTRFRRRKCKENGKMFYTEEIAIEDTVSLRAAWATQKAEARRRKKHET